MSSYAQNVSIKKTHKINLQQAVDQLNQEELLIYPTETVYGLGCRVDSKLAITKLLNFKPRSTGFIILITSWEQALPWINIQIDTAQLFKQEPTTWVFPSSTKTPKQLCSSKGEIAIRKIDFEPTKTLIESLGCPLYPLAPTNLACQQLAQTKN